MSACDLDPQVNNSNDFAMVGRIRAGQQHLYLNLIQPYERAVFVSAYCILQSQAGAEEVAGAAILKGFTRLRALRSEEQFRTWLIRITIQEARMHRRNYRPQRHDFIDEISDGYEQGNREEDTYIPKDFSGWREIRSEELQEPQVRRALRIAVASLALKCRAVFVLRDVLKMNVAETALALEISEASVKSRLLRARLELRDTLALRFALRHVSDPSVDVR
jgi:RNA polymerase sigma-70 factor, ECF subfamily